MRVENPRAILDGIERTCSRSDLSLSRERWVEFLMDAGELEAALVDAECTERDTVSPLANAARSVTQHIANSVVDAWLAPTDSATAPPGVLAAARALRSFLLPETVSIRVPEGYAYYALYPETYLEAARCFTAEVHPRCVTVVGIRSIGTSLSAVVAAALARDGVPVRSLTVRPRGHPFDRHLELSPELRALIRDGRAHWFAVVDEGPGLSGSSFASVSEALTSLGVAPERIVLFPSWLPDPAWLMAARARATWGSFRKYVADFDALWLSSGRLNALATRGSESVGVRVAATPPASPPLMGAASCGVRIRTAGATLTDWSAGCWRAHMYANSRDYPAVQPQHEQRKYLATANGSGATLLKFVGLGRYGRARRSRAERLASGGFTPEVLGVRDGFLASEFVEGTPLTAHDATPEFLRHAAAYLSHLHVHERAPSDVSTADLVEMIQCNVGEALGDGARGVLDKMEAVLPCLRTAQPVRGDARMLPHEWLRTRNGFIKTDALSHSDDHFLPGAQDSAWDLAATEVEFRLSPAATHFLVSQYVAVSGDTAISERIPFFRMSYLACRVGYVTTSERALGESTDGVRLRAESARYAMLLRQELRTQSAEPPTRLSA